MSKFELGDRVKTVEDFNNYGTHVNKGAVGTVIVKAGSQICVEFDKYINGHNGYYLKGSRLRNGRNGHCKWFLQEEGDLEKVNEKSDECIVIYRKDREVFALDKSTGKKAVAKCSPEDTFDFKVGAKLAFERLMTTTKIVKQDKYQVGDKVKIVDKFTPECFPNNEGYMDKYLGTVMTIEEVHPCWYKMKEDKGDSRQWNWYPDSIEGKVVEESEPNKVEEPFPNGTLVKMVENIFLDVKRDMLGKVVCKDTDGTYLVDFGFPYRGCHTGINNELKEPTGCYVNPYNMVKVVR
jgi:hypothetical protein